MAEDNGGRYVYVANMTNFFSRELFMYSLGDIKFKKPVSLKKVAYITAFIICWTLPMIVIFGFKMNIFYLGFVLVPPIILGNWAAKPVWGGGRGLIDYVKTLTNFMSEPKGWTDLNATNKLDNEVFFTQSEIWISRRRELQKLAKEKEERDKAEGKAVIRRNFRK